MSDYWPQFALILGLIAVNAFFAAGEIAVVSARPTRVRQLAAEGNRAATALLRLMEDQSRFLATIQIGITLAGFLASASAAVGISNDLANLLTQIGLAPSLAKSVAIIIVTLVLSYITLVLGELVPKRLALQSSEKIALFVARPVALLAKVAGPLTAFLTHSTNLVVRLLGGRIDQTEESISEEELRLYVEEHHELQDAEKRLISGVFDFSELMARHLMIPRPDMACLHQDLTVTEAIKKVRMHGYGCYPVYREDFDDIVGIVTVKDLLYHLNGQDDRLVSSVMRPAKMIPESKPALALLKELQTADERMAIVIDEYGGVAGLVTLEDLLEEIVGELSDDAHTVGDAQAGLGPTEQLLDASESVTEVGELLGIELPESPHYETLAGYLLQVLGEIPDVGATIQVDGWQLIVEQMEGHRIEVVRAVPIPQVAASVTDEVTPVEH